MNNKARIYLYDIRTPISPNNECVDDVIAEIRRLKQRINEQSR